MTRRRLAAACLSLLPVFSAGAAAAAEPPPDDHRRLAAGETVLRMDPPPAVAGRAAREIAVPADRVARAVGDWRHYAEFFPFVERSAAAVEDGAVVVRQTIAPARLLPRRRLAARVEARHESGVAGRRVWRFRWHDLAGRPGDGGEWIVRELSPGRTRVELRLSGRLGLPAALERRALERTLGWALDGLAQQVHRCRYDLPRHPTCREAPPFAAPAAGGAAAP
ncbi:MAG TPA: SRPBCC family protein [Thermoanaerobaculia bacterium]|nr:SRPBCC family protein [Thermoanaerobaculia bacterium]